MAIRERKRSIRNRALGIDAITAFWSRLAVLHVSDAPEHHATNNVQMP
jgi:hypothetical protein